MVTPTNTSNPTSLSYLAKWLILFAVLILVLIPASYFINFFGSISSQQEVWGSFGDYVGGIANPLLAFLSFLALLYTIILQSRELANSNSTLRATLDENVKMRELHNEQLAQMKRDERTKRTLDLASSFYSIETMQSRSNAHYWLKDNSKSIDELRKVNFVNKQLRNDSDEAAILHVWRYIEFFELLYSFYRHNELEKDLAKAAFSNRLKYFLNVLQPVISLAEEEEWARWTDSVIPALTFFKQAWHGNGGK